MHGEHPLIRVSQLLREEGLQYCLTGGCAAAVHGEPRAAYDIDLLVAGSRGDFRRLLERIKVSTAVRAAGILPPQVAAAEWRWYTWCASAVNGGGGSGAILERGM